MSIDKKHVFYFALGTLFGSVGFKLLCTKEAKKVYTHATAAGLRIKDYTMEQVTKAQENFGDILADAKAINEEKAKQEEIIEDTAEVVENEAKED